MIKMIKGNPNWNVLDLGCGTDGWKCANMYCDVVDCTKHYSEGVFVQSEGDKTPFADKEFDFVIATHIAEHVPDPKKFMAELMRISKRGYIETPTPFFDNLVVGNGNPIPMVIYGGLLLMMTLARLFSSRVFIYYPKF